MMRQIFEMIEHQKMNNVIKVSDGEHQELLKKQNSTEEGTLVQNAHTAQDTLHDKLEDGNDYYNADNN